MTDLRLHLMCLIMVWVGYFVGLGMGFWWGENDAPVEDPFAWSIVKDEGGNYD